MDRVFYATGDTTKMAVCEVSIDLEGKEFDGGNCLASFVSFFLIFSLPIYGKECSVFAFRCCGNFDPFLKGKDKSKMLV